MSLTSATESNLKSAMCRFIEAGELPGLVYFVEKPGVSAIEALGAADNANGPMQRDTIFRIASLSKPVSAAAALRLVDENQLSLDQPIEGLLPELRDVRVLASIEGDLNDTVPLSRPITVEDLLTSRMGSGIVLAPPRTYPIQRAMEGSNLGIGPPDPDIVPEPNEWVRRFSTLPLIAQPGEQWLYVTSSEVLGILLARVTGQPLDQALQRLILDPLGMIDTGFWVPPDKAHRFASQFAEDRKSGSMVETDTPVNGKWNRPPAFPSAGGGMVSTIDDYANFARMLLNMGCHNGERILSQSAVRQMTRNHLNPTQREDGELILGPGNGWGYGLSVRVEDIDAPGTPGSYGWNGGFGTTWLNDPNEQMIAMLFTQVQFTTASQPESARAFLTLAYQLGRKHEQ
jgi:CubicO group peptidase (beta-lactamase class C family)